MDRRTMLKGTGAALMGSAVTSGTVSAKDETGEGYLPNKKVPYTYVYPFIDGPQEKLAGRWIIHRTGWIAVPLRRLQDEDETYVSTYDEVERYKEAVEIRASIDGEEIKDADQYWRDPVQWDNGQWVVYWDYATPPKPTGEHTIVLEKEYVEDYKIEEDLGILREEGTIERFEATYSIVTERIHEP